MAKESAHVKETQEEEPWDKGNQQQKRVLPYNPGGKRKVPELGCRFYP